MTSAFLSASSQIEPAILERIGREIRDIEVVLQKELRSDVSLTETVALHTLSAGGKRLRPALVSLSAYAAGNRQPERAQRLGACMELIHMATLIHDDVIDHASTRRGHPTAASVFGNTAAILSGDAMLAKAMRILAQDGDLEIINRVSGVVVDLAEGEIMELSLRGSLELSQAEHYDVLERKTATFIQACCGVGALAASADSKIEDSLEAYGFNLGMAFQVADDLLDYCGNSGTTGKKSAIDFQEGCCTLPLIHFLRVANPDEVNQASDWFGKPLTPENEAKLLSWMDKSGSIAYAQQEAHRFSALAEQSLVDLPNSDEKQLLASIASLVSNRDR